MAISGPWVSPEAGVTTDRYNMVSSEDEELPKLIFFDTSTEDVDINLNQKLIEFIGKQSTHYTELLPS